MPTNNMIKPKSNNFSGNKDEINLI